MRKRIKRKLEEIIKQLCEYGLVGIGAAFIHLGALYFLTEAGVYYILSSIIGFLVAGIYSFLVNGFFTFHSCLSSHFYKKYFKFLSLNITAVLVNLALLYFFTEYIGIYYIFSQMLATAFSFWINFFGGKYLVFIE